MKPSAHQLKPLNLPQNDWKENRGFAGIQSDPTLAEMLRWDFDKNPSRKQMFALLGGLKQRRK